ncbi:sensor histidine kinase [Streptomyces peucetius]|uniref:histidine kinase n=1 Tax=Streptomyces peucetius TaxID=1950 RepID=A0ABY6IC89_STRPE|nr:sensor histidine kinase [Streptomyces peucetius]UYQ64613.1 nitrate- and nitrite sensing domain-containing protein [Streptomyces peucetius]
MGRPQAHQGQGEAASEQEPRGGTDRGSSPQHTHNQGPTASGDGGERSGRAGARTPGGKASGAKTPPGDAAGSPAPLKGPTDTGSRIALRNWRISTRLVSLLTLPVVAATTLGGLRINESMDDMKQLDHMQLLTKMTTEATELAHALQQERDLSAGPLVNGAVDTDFKVSGPRTQTDRARKAFLDATRSIPNKDDDEALESIRANANQIAVQVNNLKNIRTNAYKGKIPKSQTIESYSRLIESLLSLSADMAQATSNPEMIKRTRALAAFSSAKEYASIQRAVIAAALPGGDTKDVPGLTENDRLYGQAALENGETELKSFGSIYESIGGDSQELMAPLENENPTITAAEQYAKRVLSTQGALKELDERSHLDWTDDYSVRINAMKTIEQTLLGQMEAEARNLREASQRDAIINGALILIVLGVSLVGAFVVARSMIRSLRRLQDTATKVAQDRLPELVKQLSESDPQDVDTSVESVGVHSRDEIGKVAAAFDDVHREAVRLAAEQALLRGNVNAMFTNLSRRSQGLIQRQLSLISELESREADPDQLSSLFKLDHLATRMRRNGENLLVLAGEEPGRRWTRPVPLVDVLRAAASEVEQYERIELASVPATEVAGRVVNDLVHLLAELLENATSFSSPQTKVKVTGHALPDGRVLVEIHDTGIGLSPEDLAAINERLASPPTVDVSVSRRMGLFVVGRLSLRHGIRIQLRPSDSGGTTALVMLPVDVAQGGKKAPSKPGAGGQGAVAPADGGAPAGLPGRPGGAGRSGPDGGNGNGGRPGGAPSGAGNAPGGLLGAGTARGQVGAGAAPRVALPARDGSGRPVQAQHGQGQQSQNQQRQGQQGPGQYGQDRHSQGQGSGQYGQGQGQYGQGTGRQGSMQDGARQGDPFGSGPAQGAPVRNEAPQNGFQAAGPAGGDRDRQLPAAGGTRAELPGGPLAPRRDKPVPPRPQRPQATSWGSDQASQPQRPSADTPRGHEDHDSNRGPGSTAEFARPDFNAGPPRADRPAAQEQFVRPDVFGAPNPSGAGQYGRPDAQDPASTDRFARPDLGAPQPPAPQRRDESGFAPPRQPVAGLPAPQQPEALPPAGPGDGRTPLYDTLETNWFRGAHGGDRSAEQAPAPAERPAQPMPQRNPAPNPVTPAGASHASGAWRSSPNDELVRQAERVRKPAAGGVTTSGLPRRVPRANLVAGTAQEQNHQAGPQVSRAPDDVRGRLTNLRRGIQQGRQQNSSTTGSFDLGPSHQQER